MGEVGPSVQQGFSARLLTRAHGVPTHNKKLQNVEHGLAVRDKMRIINYIQAKPRRKSSSSSPISPVSPQFQCLAEELLSAAAAVASLDTTEQPKHSPLTISGNKVSSSCQDGQGTSAHAVGFSARKLSPSFSGNSSQVASGRSSPDSPSKTKAVGFSARNLPKDASAQGVGFSARNPSPTLSGSSGASGKSPPDSPSKTKAVGFSARNLPKGSGDTASKPPGFTSRARAKSASPTLESESASSATNSGNSLPSSSAGAASKSAPATPSASATNQGDLPPSPSPKVGFSARKLSGGFNFTHPSIPSTEETDPCKSDSPVRANKIDFAIKSPPSGIGVRSHKAIASKAAARKDWHNSKRPGLSSPTLSDCSQSSSVSGESKSEHNKDIKQEDVMPSKTSPVLGFSARNPPPGLPQMQGQSVRNRIRHFSTPASLDTTSTSQSNSGTNQQVVASNSGNQPSNLESNQQSFTEEALPKSQSVTPPPGYSAVKEIVPPSGRSVTPPPGFNARISRNPPPGFNARNPPAGFSTRNPPPGFSARVMNPPPGFGPRTNVSPPPANSQKVTPSPIPKAHAPQKNSFQVNFNSTSPVSLPGNSSLPSLSNSSVSPPDKPSSTSPEAQVGSGTIMRLARQQVHPYTQKDTSTPESDRQNIAYVAKTELEAIRKAHMVVENAVPPHVQKLKAALKLKRSQSTPGHGDNRNNNSIDNEDDDSIVAAKVKLITWKAISMNHSMLLTSNAEKSASFAMANLRLLFDEHGKEMDQYNKKGMDKVFVTIRNIILDHSKKIYLRMQLLEILETRANNWVRRPRPACISPNTKGVHGVHTDGSSSGVTRPTKTQIGQLDTNQGSSLPTAIANPQPKIKALAKLVRDFSESDTTRFEHMFDGMRIPKEPPSEKRQTELRDDAQNKSSPMEAAKAETVYHSSIPDDTGSNDLQKGAHSRKYSREFLLSCYDSPLTKEQPSMLHFTFQHSDSGFIVQKNCMDPRHLIAITHLPPLLKPLCESHMPRGRRLNSWPGPSSTSTPQGTHDIFPCSRGPGLLGAAPASITKPSAPKPQDEALHTTTAPSSSSSERTWPAKLSEPKPQDEALHTTTALSSSSSSEQPGSITKATPSTGRISPCLLSKAPGPVLSTVPEHPPSSERNSDWWPEWSSEVSQKTAS